MSPALVDFCLYFLLKKRPSLPVICFKWSLFIHQQFLNLSCNPRFQIGKRFHTFHQDHITTQTSMWDVAISTSSSKTLQSMQSKQPCRAAILWSSHTHTDLILGFSLSSFCLLWGQWKDSIMVGSACWWSIDRFVCFIYLFFKRCHRSINFDGTLGILLIVG